MLWNDKVEMMTIEDKKLEILRKVENGTIGIEEGADLIAGLEGDSERQGSSVSSDPSDPLPPVEPLQKHETSGCWKAAWSMILVGGAVLSGFSAFWMYQGYEKRGLGWGFWLSWLPMLIGIAFMLLGWALMESPWMHVKIHGRDHNKSKGIFVFSMPVPFNIARWVMNNFGQYMPDEVNAEEVLEILNQAESSIRKGEPFQVQVDTEEDGTKVDVFIN